MAMSGRSAKVSAWWNGVSSSGIVPSASPSRSRICWSRAQRWQGVGLSCQVRVQIGQRPQKSGSGLVHFAHNGSAQLPLRAWATVPQALHVTQRCWQRSHHGRPVAREMSQRVLFADAALRDLGLQAPQRGPSGVRTATGASPHPTHSSRLAGSLIRQLGTAAGLQRRGWPARARRHIGRMGRRRIWRSRPGRPFAVQQLGQCLHPAAARAGRRDELGRPGRDEFVDEAQRGRGRGVAARAGQQFGSRDDGPGQPALPGRADGGPVQRGLDRPRPGPGQGR